MAEKKRKDLQVVTHAEWLIKVGQRREALDSLKEFFKTPYTRDWDEIYDRLAKLTVSLSIEFMEIIPGFILSLVHVGDHAAEEVLPKLVITYLQEGRVRISDEQRLESLARQMIDRPLPKARMDQIFTQPAFSFLESVYMEFLPPLRTRSYRRKLYHLVLEKGYQVAEEFDSLHFFDLLSGEVDKSSNNLKLPIATQKRIVSALFLRYKTAVSIGRYFRAFRALTMANDFLQSHTSPMEAHETLEVNKTVLLQIRQDRLPAAVQMMQLVHFYETTPIDPVLPLESLKDLALMTALAAPLQDANYSSFGRLIRCPVPPRKDFVAKLLNDSRRSSLQQFGMAAEQATDAAGICFFFQAFLKEFGQLFKVPELYRALGQYAALRIIQAACCHGESVPLDAFTQMLKWMDEFEVHAAISQAISLGLIRGRIDMRSGSFRVL